MSVDMAFTDRGPRDALTAANWLVKEIHICCVVMKVFHHSFPLQGYTLVYKYHAPSSFMKLIQSINPRNVPQTWTIFDEDFLVMLIWESCFAATWRSTTRIVPQECFASDYRLRESLRLFRPTI